MREVVLICFLTLLSCNKDDDLQEVRDEIVVQACENIEQIPEVTMSNVSLTPINTDTQYGFILRADITNNTDVGVRGEPNFQLVINDVPNSVGGPGICGIINANEVCDYENYLDEDRGTPLDNARIACFGYELQ
jgi:hypothetical protein|tara:strand:+ start:24129 stop:24530 length:402 start_codon:yes stop_codon:yes gene_type:complete